jgi:hypothetical protein
VKRTSRTRAFALLGLSVALFIGACGNEATQEAAERSDNPVVAAAGRAAEDHTARLAFSVTAEGETQRIEGEGLIDLIDGDPSQSTMRVPDETGAMHELELRVVDGEGYTRADDELWQEVDEEEADPAKAVAMSNAVDVVKLLETASAFEQVNDDSLNEGWERWQGTFDLAATTEEDDPESAAFLRELGIDKLPTTVDIDADGRLRRIVTIPLAVAERAGEPGPAPKLTYTIELSDFGVDVKVEKPSVEETRNEA